MKIKNIHLYGESWPPDFFKGRGWRGWWIRCLNALRWRLELRVRWHVGVVLSSTTDQDLSQVRTLFEKDHFGSSYEIKEDFGSPYLKSESELAPRVRTSAEETNKVLARFLAPTRSKRYATSRHRRPVYEMESVETPNDGTNQKEPSSDTEGAEGTGP